MDTNEIRTTQPIIEITDIGGYDWVPFGDDPFDEEDYDEDEEECQGHESLRGDYIGRTFYCDGTCTGRA
jgi:hypothetical protein